MSQLPDTGAITYNGFTFPVETYVESLSVRPIKDQAGRTVVHNEIDLTVSTLLAAQPTDTIVTNAIRRLTTPAAALTISGRGWPLAVNTASRGPKDVQWGPWPAMIDVRPWGGGNATRLTWSVQVKIPLCADAVYEGPAEYNFALDFEIDNGGYTKRVYSGFLRIAATRRSPGDRNIPASADAFRERAVPPPMIGFHRTQSYHLSEDKLTLRLTVTDQQQPKPLPVGCISASSNHSLAATPGKLFQWTGTLNATYELARDADPSLARDNFFAIAKDRVRHTIRSLGTKNVGVIPVQFNFGEPNLFDRPGATFTLIYRVNAASLRDMLQASGLWRPVPGASFRLWQASVAGVLGPRGLANLTFNTNEDRIIDLCRATTIPQAIKGDETVTTRSLRSFIDDTFPTLRPDNSYTHYENRILVSADQGNVVVNTLPTRPFTDRELTSAPGSSSFGLGGSGGLGGPGGSGILPGIDGGKLGNDDLGETTVQQRAKPTLYLHMEGSAVRAGGFPIPCPELTDFNGSRPVPCNRPDRGEGFVSGVVGNANGPVIAARWRLRYAVEHLKKGGPPVAPAPLDGQDSPILQGGSGESPGSTGPSSTNPKPLSASGVVTPLSFTAGVTPVNAAGWGIGGVPPYTISINFGDGTTLPYPGSTHVYETAGTYAIEVTVTDAAGTTATKLLGPVVVT